MTVRALIDICPTHYKVPFSPWVDPPGADAVGLKMRRCGLFLMLVLLIARAWAALDIVVVALFKDRAVLMNNGSRVVLNTGDTSDQGVRLIRANSEEAVVDVNGVAQTLTLGTEISASFAPPPEREVQIFRDAGGMYLVTGSINGHVIEFLVDTGASEVAMNAAQARRLGLNFRYEGEPRRVQTANGLANAYLLTLKAVRVGDIEVKNVRAFVIDGEYPVKVLLGMSFLERVDMHRTS